MRLSHLKDSLEKKANIEGLLNTMVFEVADYEQQLKKGGRSANVVLIQDTYFIFTLVHLQYLERLVDEENVNRYQISYIADAILLADFSGYIKIENEGLSDILEEMVIK